MCTYIVSLRIFRYYKTRQYTDLRKKELKTIKYLHTPVNFDSTKTMSMDLGALTRDPFHKAPWIFCKVYATFVVFI